MALDLSGPFYFVCMVYRTTSTKHFIFVINYPLLMDIHTYMQLPHLTEGDTMEPLNKGTLGQLRLFYVRRVSSLGGAQCIKTTDMKDIFWESKLCPM